MIKIILIILALIQDSIEGVPVLGCLNYQNGVCLLCDQISWYYKIGSTCQLMIIQNCSFSLNGQICAICNKGYYTDIDTGKCVEATKPIPNCQIYSDGTKCKTCSTGYYALTNGECVKTAITIPNCLTYFNSNTCAKCNNGFLKTPGIVLPSSTGFVTSENFCQNFTIANCQTGSVLTCVRCKNNYLKFQNTYLYTVKGLSGNILKNLQVNNLITSLNNGFSVCALQNVPNCLVYQEFYSCAQCKTGYFINSTGQCQIVPDSIIQNCFEYLTSGVCRLCLTSYYLASPSACLPHSTTIPNCFTMSANLLNVCSLCATGYFLSGNSCVLRSVNIPNCQTYSITSETCVSCLVTYILSPDSTSCYASINKCATYTFSLSGISCSVCVAGLYNDVSLGCIKVPTVIIGCVTYSTLTTANANNQLYECSICQKNYLLSNGQCIPFDAFLGTSILCNSTNQAQMNLCNGCYPNQILVAVTNYCALIPATSYDLNCQTYNSTGWCVICSSGYFINNGNCFQITISNCISVSPTNPLLCTKCTSTGLFSYFVNSLNTPNSCISTYTHITQNCLTQDTYITSSTSNMNVNVCNNCYSPYIPETFQRAMFCVPLPTLINNYGIAGQLSSSNNCQVWNTLNQTCFRCQFNAAQNFQYVINNGTCSQSCSAGMNIKTILSPFYFYCNTTVIANCYRELGVNCVQCQPGFFPIVQLSFPITAYSTFSYLPAFFTNNFQSKSQSFESIWNRIFVVSSCIAGTLQTGLIHIPSVTNANNLYSVFIPAANYLPSSTIFNLCKGAFSYSQGSNILWGCSACVFGFTGYYVLDVTQVVNFIPGCNLSVECNFGLFYKGLGFQLSNGSLDFWTGCHVCINALLIPTFARFSRFGPVSAGQIPNTGIPYYPQTTCIIPGFFPGNTYFPANCSVQEVLPAVALVGYPQTGSVNSVNPICWSCRPGYKATIDTSTNFVTMCAFIAFCDPQLGTDTFNKCTQCFPGYALNENMDTCILITDIPNCYQVSTAAQPYVCIQCQPGFVVSRNQKICNTVNMPNCLIYDLFSLGTNAATSPYQGLGCLQCELGYIALQFELPQNLCIFSPLIQEGISAGIRNCLIYSSLTTCSQCSIGYTLPAGNNSTCIASSTIQNCLVYSSITACQQCQPTYILQDSQCVNGAIYNTNCAYFTSQTVCNQCSSGYVLIAVGTAVRCFPAFSTIANCLTFDQTRSLNANTITCFTCSSGYPLTVSGSNMLGCLQIPIIPNCLVYRMSTYTCIQCTTNYYLVPRSLFTGNNLEYCSPRLNYPDIACNVTNLTSDSCSVCLAGYYLRNNFCIPKPTGVINCNVYLDASTCLKCTSNTYLSSNLCVSVPIPNIVQNCLHYQNQESCLDCQNGYFLSNNQCLLITVSNCDVYQSPSQCKQCKSGYFITTTQVCQKPVIVNCLVFASLNSCQLCVTGYFVNSNNACQIVLEVNIIQDCLYYTSNQTCLNCTNSTLLSIDSTKCIKMDDFSDVNSGTSIIDRNCDGYIFQDTCLVCQGGYVFNNGACVPCNVNVPNCYFCDFANITLCLVCMPGFSMNTIGNCISNKQTSGDTVQTVLVVYNYTPSSGFTPTWAIFSVKILKMSIIGVFFSFWVNFSLN